jgi:hypothetical protein
VPRKPSKMSRSEFVRKFTDTAVAYLESVPSEDRDARIEAFGKRVVRACRPGTVSKDSTSAETQARHLSARGRE